MKAIFKYLGFAIFILLFLFGCRKEGNIPEYTKILVLQGDYTNKNSEPKLILDRENSSSEIRINLQDVSDTIIGGRTNLILSNVRFEDNLGVYEPYVNEIVTQELRNGNWEQDLENFLRVSSAKSLDMVLVLDVSSSLGSDVSRVKNSSINFINLVASKINDFKIGVVGFSGQISTLEIGSNIQTTYSFINSLKEGQNETKLYEAMDTALDLLSDSKADGKAIITFTDGRNNSWSRVEFETSMNLQNRLEQSEINSYTIGLKGKGGIDENILKSLSINGTFESLNSVEDLEKIYNKFANSISALYNLIYDRNSSIVNNPIRLRFIIKAGLK